MQRRSHEAKGRHGAGASAALAGAVAKVIDFGVAKATQQQLTEKTLFTEQGQLVGTPEYMSPEQAEMTALDIDTRADVRITESEPGAPQAVGILQSALQTVFRQPGKRRVLSRGL